MNMRDAVITNLINNIIFCIWMYVLVTNHRFRKAVTALISIGAMILYSVLFIVIVYSAHHYFFHDIFISVGFYLYDTDTYGRCIFRRRQSVHLGRAYRSKCGVLGDLL